MKTRVLAGWSLIFGAVLAVGGLAFGHGAESSGPMDKAAPVVAAYMDLEPFLDTFINSANADSPYHTSTALMVGASENLSKNRTLLWFDLSPLPSGVQIQEATLYLYQASGYGATSCGFTLRRIIQQWGSLVTWNSRPATGEPSATTYIGHGKDMWYSWNATELVRGWYNGTYSNYGLMLLSSDETLYALRWFHSMETWCGPYLRVTYVYPTPTPTRTPTSTRTGSPKPTRTPSATRRPTSTPTATATCTRRPTNTPGPSPTRMSGAVDCIWVPVMPVEWSPD